MCINHYRYDCRNLAINDLLTAAQTEHIHSRSQCWPAYYTKDFTPNQNFHYCASDNITKNSPNTVIVCPSACNNCVKVVYFVHAGSALLQRISHAKTKLLSKVTRSFHSYQPTVYFGPTHCYCIWSPLLIHSQRT